MHFYDLRSLPSRPTAPKSMRGPAPNGRDKRLINQINHNLDRNPDTTLRRIRAAPGTGRVNSHSREPPKGPRVQGAHFRNGAGARPANGHSGPQPGAYPQALPAATMTPQQQMQLLAMYEEQARMMARILSSEQLQDINNMHIDPATSGPNAQHRPSQGQASGRSLFERVEATPSNLGHRKHFQPDHILGSQGDDQMSDAPHIPSSLTTASTNDGDSTAKDPTVTLCRFNLTCTKSDCQFAHQSPAAPAGTTIDMTDTCSFGAACKNRKCTGRHPSAAQKSKHQAVQNCKFYPNCTNQKCPFLHPDMPACRNGADCTVTNCKFAHSKIECRYNPCLNPACPFKHIAGQKRGAFEDKVWVASSDLKEEHVSDRKFVVDEDVEEELILPGQSSVSPTIPKVDVAVA